MVPAIGLREEQRQDRESQARERNSCRTHAEVSEAVEAAAAAMTAAPAAFLQQQQVDARIMKVGACHLTVGLPDHFCWTELPYVIICSLRFLASAMHFYMSQSAHTTKMSRTDHNRKTRISRTE